MKVWIDGIVFERSSQFGIWRMFYEIISRSARDVDYTLWLRSPPKQPLPPGVTVVFDSGRREISRWNLMRRAGRRWANSYPPSAMKKASFFHSSGFTIPPIDDLKYVVTIHDFIEENFFSISIPAVEQCVGIKANAMRRASLIPCISHSTQQDLAAFYPEFAPRSRLTLIGADHQGWTAAEPLSIKHPSNRALFIGQRASYENFNSILHAMCHPVWPANLKLSVLGPIFSDAEKLLMRRLGVLDRVERLNRLSDDELRDQYRHASCMIFPSLLEGFGFPIVEAQALNCPVVCSDIRVFREVAGDGAIFFDPRLSESLAVAVAEVQVPGVREKLCDAGRENRRRFTWDAATEALLSVYQEAAQLE